MNSLPVDCPNVREYHSSTFNVLCSTTMSMLRVHSFSASSIDLDCFAKIYRHDKCKNFFTGLRIRWLKRTFQKNIHPKLSIVYTSQEFHNNQQIAAAKYLNFSHHFSCSTILNFHVDFSQRNTLVTCGENVYEYTYISS